MGRINGFTLIELMVVVAIIGILSAIAVPQFGQLTRSAQEASTKGNLASLRSALSIYYGDTEGQFPSDVNALTTNNKYLAGIPSAFYPTHHNYGNTMCSGDNAAFLASGADTCAWWYFTDEPGHLVANCIHNDMRGVPWTTY